MNLVVGEYLEIMKGFDGVCLIADSFNDLTSKYPKLLPTVQQYHKAYGDRVFDLGVCEANTHAIYVPLHNMESVRKSCEELQALVAKKGFNKILIPMPSQYGEVKDILGDMLDDKFTVITDNPDYIPELKEKRGETMEVMRILECSSKGDTRFSALYAKVEYMGVFDTIESIYQNSKRFLNPQQEYVKYDKPKGKKPDGVEVFDTLYDADMLTPFYKWLWVQYFRANPNLLEHAKSFDDFHDTFKGKSINCQADVVRELVNDYNGILESIAFVDDLNEEWHKTNNVPLNKHVEVAEDLLADTTTSVRPLTLVVTGHRPKDLWQYNPCAQYHGLQDKIYKCVLQFINHFGVTQFVNGGAQGADQLFFWAVEHVKKINPDIENIVYQPFVGQEKRWKETGIFSQEEYSAMLNVASKVHTCFENITKESPYQAIARALTDRNTEMVKVADYVLGIFQGDPQLITNNLVYKSGTLDCLRKAYKANKKIVIINPMTLETTRIGF